MIDSTTEQQNNRTAAWLINIQVIVGSQGLALRLTALLFAHGLLFSALIVSVTTSCR